MVPRELIVYEQSNWRDSVEVVDRELQFAQLVLQNSVNDQQSIRIQKQQSPELFTRIESAGRPRAVVKRRERGVGEE